MGKIGSEIFIPRLARLHCTIGPIFSAYYLPNFAVKDGNLNIHNSLPFLMN